MPGTICTAVLATAITCTAKPAEPPKDRPTPAEAVKILMASRPPFEEPPTIQVERHPMISTGAPSSKDWPEPRPIQPLTPAPIYQPYPVTAGPVWVHPDGRGYTIYAPPPRHSNRSRK